MIHLLLAVVYLAFISLGLPDGILGAAWPTMHSQMQVPVSLAGIISVLICCGTVVSSLMSDRLIRKLGTGLLTAMSVGLTAAALFGFSFSEKFWMLGLFAIPYGLGAGSVDAALNHYVAIHYSSRHMSWLHCMWGVGASIGPYIMGHCLTQGAGWSAGYQSIGALQVVLFAVILLSLPLWHKQTHSGVSAADAPLSLGQIFAIPGAKAIIFAFLCYCGLESTLMLWTSSYLTMVRDIPGEMAASYASLFFLGMTAGRALNGFLTMRWDDRTLIHTGFVILAVGIAALLIPAGKWLALAGILLCGLGCAPIYPCIIHSTPEVFGQAHAQALIGVQMAAAYLGAMLLPPLFGLIANHIHAGFFPVYLLLLWGIMTVSYRRLPHKTA